MRILYITLENLSLHKGSVVHIKEVVSGLRKLGHHVGLVAYSLNKSEEADRFYNLNGPLSFMTRFFRFKKQPYIFSSIILFLYLLRILPQYDIIYARDYHATMIAFLPRLLFHKKLIYEINGLASEEQKLKSLSLFNRIIVFLIKKAEIMAAKNSDRIISVTSSMATYLIANVNRSTNEIKIIGNGVNTEKFYPIEDQGLMAQFRNRLSVGEREVLIGFIGNLAPWQGVEYLIRVAPGIIEKTKNVRFLIIGEGIWRNKLQMNVKDSELSEHFIFTGEVDHKKIPLYINIADICVLPKRVMKSGYSPIKLYEYMACGKPVISSKAEGLEFIEEEGIGKAVHPENTLSFMEALLELIEDREKREKMGKKALLIARERFDWKIKAKKIEEILKELLA